jgi:hypothetical protein
LLDIETSPNLSWHWGGKFEQNIIRFKQEWQLLSFAYKELGRGTTQCFARPDYRDKTDRALTRAAWGILNSADVIIGHNVDKFDHKKLRAKFLEHGLAPPRTCKTIDTLKIARSQFAFNSNSLNDLAQTLRLGRKVKTGGVDLWFSCMDGVKSAWAKMIRYNKHDVDLLEKVYERLKAWYPNHPNLSLWESIPGCPVCMSLRVQRRGYRMNVARKLPRYQCQDCGGWFASGNKEYERR